MNKRQALATYLASQRWSSIGQTEWEALRRDLPALSENNLREMLQRTELDVQQPYRGVRQKSLLELQQSLLDLERVYAADPTQRALCRKLVIQAKDRARFASRNLKADPTKRALKEEMVRWMLVWLGDPAMFATWVRLRLLQID